MCLGGSVVLHGVMWYVCCLCLCVFACVLCVSCFKHVIVCFASGVLCDVVWVVCKFIVGWFAIACACVCCLSVLVGCVCGLWWGVNCFFFLKKKKRVCVSPCVI